jgi:protein-tyrosine phosphatase
MKVLFVCLGNICRSPLGEGILQSKIDARSLSWTTDSAGTGGYHIGEMPDERSIKVAKEHGIDISTQKARKFNYGDFEKFDHIIVMDSMNYQDVIRQAIDDTEKAKVTLMMNHLTPNMNQAVPDPYWDSDGFEKVYQMIDKACDAFIENELKKN